MNYITLTQHLTKWSTLIYFLSSLELETIFTRQELLNYISTSGFGSKSIDTYRNYLSKAEYIETIARGVYVIKKHIPLHISLSIVKKEAYGNEDIVGLGFELSPPTSAGYFSGSAFITPKIPSTIKKKFDEFIKKEEMQL